MIQIRLYQPSDQRPVIALWKRCGLIVPQNDPKTDIDQKFLFQPGLFLVAEKAGQIAGTVMAGYEGHRGWINYLAVDPDLQRQGVGRMLMQQAEERLRLMGCLKINLQIRKGNETVIAFYERLGYTIDPVISMGKRMK
jgi:ribosomal protein S18 acetylase RimI-like enzyme